MFKEGREGEKSCLACAKVDANQRGRNKRLFARGGGFNRL